MLDNARINSFKQFYLDMHREGMEETRIRREFKRAFKEVSPEELGLLDDWFYDHIEEIQEQGKISGYGEGYDITAERMAETKFGARLVEKLSDSGHVWRARPLTDWLFQGDLAVKILRRKHGNNASIRRTTRGATLLQELQMLRGIIHPNCVRVYGAFFSETQAPWLALEFVKGCDLRKWKRTERVHGVNVREAVAIVGFFADVLQGIATRAAEAESDQGHPQNRSVASFIHGDIKPSNVVGFPRNKSPISLDSIKLCDFGTALIETAAESPELMNLGQYGTCGYMAPEQFGCDIPRTSAIDVFGFGMTLLWLLSPVEYAEFNVRVGGDGGWKHLHEIWFLDYGTSRAPFDKILRNSCEDEMPSFESIIEVFCQLRLPELVDKLLPDDDQQMNVLRRVVKLCLEVNPKYRIQSPGAIAVAFARWLRDEEIDFSKLVCEGSPMCREAPKTTVTQFLDRDQRLFRRAVRWRQSDDLVAVGTCTWVPVSFFLFVCVLCNFFSILSNATINTLSYIAIGIGFFGLTFHGLRLGFEATRIGQFGEIVSSIFLRRLLSAWLLFVFFAFAFFVSRQWIGESDVEEQISRKADIAQMLLTAALLAGYTCGRNGSINAAIVVGLISSSLLTILLSFLPLGITYDWFTGIAYFLTYAVFLGLFAFETYFKQILLNLRPPYVQSLLDSESGRRSVFDSVILSECSASNRRHAT